LCPHAQSNCFGYKKRRGKKEAPINRIMTSYLRLTQCEDVGGVNLGDSRKVANPPNE